MLRLNKKIIINDELKDFFQKIVIVLAIIYLGCFVIESILPGIVMEAFNFNLLLFLIIGLMGGTSFLENRNKKEWLSKKMEKCLFFGWIFLFLVTLFIVLYKVSLFETIVYLIAVLFLFKPLKQLFE